MKVMSGAGLVCILAATVFRFGNTPVAQNRGTSMAAGQSASGVGQPGVSPEWPTYNHDLAATRYSPLTQINPDNVATLVAFALP